MYGRHEYRPVVSGVSGEYVGSVVVTGTFVGRSDGRRDGVVVGSCDGVRVGRSVGTSDGAVDGLNVGV